MLLLNRIALILLALVAAFPLAADPDVKEEMGEELFAKYQTALRSQQGATNNTNMEVLMEGRIPKLKKEGKMSALKNVSSVGRVTWKLLGFWGDDTVKKEVMARYMQAEQEASVRREEEERRHLHHAGELQVQVQRSERSRQSAGPYFRAEAEAQASRAVQRRAVARPRHAACPFVKPAAW